MSRPAKPRVVVLGGGFAGLSATAALGDAFRVTLVDRTRWFEFLPNIHELVSGVKAPDTLRLPRDRIVRRAGARFVRGAVEGIDLRARRVRIEGRRPLPYDALVVALGGENATHGVPGVEVHALPFKSVDQCQRIGRRLRALARSAGRHDRALARSARRHDIVIVGGGLEGVEALGEILRRYRRRRAFRIHMVEARERLLAEAPLALDREVRRLCAGHDVRFVTGTAVAEVLADAVVLASGRKLPSRATIWTGGPTAPPLLAECGLAPRAGAWAPTAQTLQSRTAPEVFVAGDAADLPSPLAKQGYHALDMGRCAAENVTRLLTGRALRGYRPAEKPTLISFGDLSCFLVLGPCVVAGPSLGAAKEAVFELVMAQLDQRGWQEAGPDALRRLLQAGRDLAWPALTSPRTLLRLGRLSLLRAG